MLTTAPTATLANALIVTPHQIIAGSLRLDAGRIAAVDCGCHVPSGAVDLEGDYLLPGLVELHTDHLESHLQPRPGVLWPGVPALIAHDLQCVAAGITTVLDSVCVGELHESRNRSKMLAVSLEAIREARRHGLLRADHRLHLRCEVSDPAVLDMFAAVVDEPSLKLVSLMDHTPGQRQFVCDARFRKYYQSKHMAWSEEEYASYRHKLIERQREYAPANRSGLVAMSRERGIALASHDDTTSDHVREAVAQGVAVSEFPTTVEAAQACRQVGIAVMAGGPNLVCGKSHSGNVAALELARLGLIDCLSSDYVPASLLQGAFLLHTLAGMPLPQAVATVSEAPARAVGLPDRGAIDAGRRADLVRVSLVEGQPVVRSVWLEGRQVL